MAKVTLNKDGTPRKGERKNEGCGLLRQNQLAGLEAIRGNGGADSSELRVVAWYGSGENTGGSG